MHPLISPPRCSPSTDANRARLAELAWRADEQACEPVLAAEVMTNGDKAIGMLCPQTITRPKGKHKCGGRGRPPKAIVSNMGERWDSLTLAAQELGVCGPQVIQRAILLGCRCKGRILAYEEEVA